MDAAEFKHRLRRNLQADPSRAICSRCRQPTVCCYCAQIRPFDPGLTFAILIHPVEARRRIATGRMAHLCLEGSLLRRGVDFDQDSQVQALLADPSLYPVVLAPGPDSVDLTPLTREARHQLFPEDRRPVVFVIDGTWPTANKMLRLTTSIRDLPRVCFTPPRPSRFAVRRQPREHCFSTIEAIHHFLELISPETAPPGAEVLIESLDWMVRREMEYRTGQREGTRPPYRATKRPSR